MNILIDNKDLYTVYGIKYLSYFGGLGFAAERVNERIWQDKSGVDKNLDNIRYDSNEFVLELIVKDTTEGEAFNKVKVLVDYMFLKGCFVLSLRDSSRGIRECFLCERSNTIVPEIRFREQNGLYVFKLGLRDVNPNAIKYNESIIHPSTSTTINYTKGQWANIYWGNGDIAQVSNSGNYTKDYGVSGEFDIIIDLDRNNEDITALGADFSADITNGLKPQIVNFTDLSTGDITLWSWDFGDGFTSDEQNPQHEYTEEGTYSVVLTIFNAVKGYSVETKVDYITINRSALLINGTDKLLINGTDKFLQN